MRTILVSLLLMTAGVAWAEDADVAGAVAVDQLNERLSVIEVIDVTAEKPPLAIDEESDPDIDAILDEAENLEEDVE